MAWLRPGEGGLGLEASGGVDRLVHDHRLRRAWYLPGKGGSCTKGIRRGWPMWLMNTLPGEVGAIQRRPVVGSLVQLRLPSSASRLGEKRLPAGTPRCLLLGDEKREDDPDYTTFRPLVLRLGGGRRLGIDDFLVRYNLEM